MTIAQIVQLLKQAWIFAADLLDVVERVDRFVADNGLLLPGEHQ